MRSTTTAVLLAAAACVGSVQALSYSHGHPQNARRHHDLARRGSKHDQSAQVTRGRMARKTRRATAASDKQTYESTAIWWAEAGWIGSCGDNISDDAMIIALPLALYPDVSTASPLCGTTVSVSAPSTGKSITATVIGASDRNAYTTFSRAAYEALGGDLDSGELPIEFQLVDGTAPASASVTASDGAALKSVASAAVKASSAGSSSSSSSSSSAAGVKSSSSEEASSSSKSSDKAFASGSSANVHAAAAAPSTAAPTTTEAPQTTTTTQAPTTTTPAWDSASAASESAKSKSLADAAWASSSSASAAEAYAFWASSSSSAAAAAASAASKSSADAAWASSSSASAAAAAASKSSADAAWASSSSAAAAAWASSSSAAAAKPTQDSSSSSGGGHVYTGGIATFFMQNGVPGNCGQVNSDSTLLVALPTATYAGGSHCGQYVEITRTDTGNKIKALVADSCPTCDNDNCLDLSWGAFSALGGTESMGIFDITWQFV